MGTGGNKPNDPKRIIHSAVDYLERGLCAFEFELGPDIDRSIHPFFRPTCVPGTYYLQLGDPQDPEVGPKMVVSISVFDPNNKPQKRSSADKKLEAIQKLLQHGDRGSEWQEAGLLHAIEKIVTGEVCASSDNIDRLRKEAKGF